MLPSADQLFKDADFIFQQDLAPAHTAKSTKSWLNDHGVSVLDWPANSPDLNLNSAWHGGDQFVALLRWYGSPGFFDSGLQLICIFWSLVSHFPCQEETWASIPPQQCHKLITSMPRRIETVIKAKGASTKY